MTASPPACTDAAGNDEAGAEDAGPSVPHVTEGDTMKMIWRMHRAKSLTGGGATCDFVADNGQIANVTIRGLTGTKALSHLTALERLLNGAIVMDGADVRRIDVTLGAMERSAGTATRMAIQELRAPLAGAQS